MAAPLAAAAPAPGRPRWLLPVAALVCWIGPFAMDAYTPAFPAIQADLATSPGMVQATLTATLLGLAAGQLLVGPVSDRRGRRGPLLVGLVGYAFASVFCALAWSIEVLLVARLLQGVTAAAGISIARAIGRDLYAGTDLARFYSVLTGATAVAPVVGPLAGAGVLEAGLGWRWVFAVTVVLGVVAVVAARTLPETRTPAPASTTADPPGLLRLLRRRELLVGALVLSLCTAGMIAHLAGLSFYLQEDRGTSPGFYGLVFALDALALVAANAVNRALLGRWTARGILRFAVPGLFLCSLGFAAAVATDAPLPVVVVSLLVMIGANGFVQPNAVAVGMSVEREAAGRAAAIIGVAQFGLASLSAPLVGLLPALGGIPPMALVITVCVGAAVLVQVVDRLLHRRANLR
jgi:MFS transporter, DHA1 family, multidrug resistance protein